ncbi:MAG: nucleotidyltransferase [Bacteroidales bacterium]|nr:nucleotidyltransferase [Bacteroidales bacterium]MCL2739078.1 nucleotidyltransferase [Bacteroidales bacterium]
MQPTLIVLAAGMGARYGGLKQLDVIGPNGATIMDYSVYDAAQAGFGKVVFIIRGHFRAAFEHAFAKRYHKALEIAFVEQEPDKELPVGFLPPPDRSKPWGTGHALLMAGPQTKTPFAVINADDFYGRQAYTAMAAFLHTGAAQQNNYAMVSYQTGNTLSESGGVSRGVCSVNDRGMLTEVVECHQIHKTPEGNIVCESPDGTPTTLLPDTQVSMNFWGFTPDFFGHLQSAFHSFIRERGQEAKSEFYIPTVVNQLLQDRRASVRVLTTDSSWFGITYKEDRPYAESRIRQLIEQGVYPHSIIRP